MHRGDDDSRDLSMDGPENGGVHLVAYAHPAIHNFAIIKPGAGSASQG